MSKVRKHFRKDTDALLGGPRDCSRGAPMGLPGTWSADAFDKPCFLWKMEISADGYCLRTGAYFGTPRNLYCAANPQGLRHICRAKNRTEARLYFENRYPHIKWVRK